MAVSTEPMMGGRNDTGQIPNLVVRRYFKTRLVRWLEERADSREGMRGNGGHAAALRSLAAYVDGSCDPDRDRRLVILGEIEEALRQGRLALGGEVGRDYLPGGEQKGWLGRIGDGFNPAPQTPEPMLAELCAAGARDLARAYGNDNVNQRKATQAFEGEIDRLKAERQTLEAKLAEVDQDTGARDARIGELENRLEAAEELLEARGAQKPPRREQVETGVYVTSSGKYQAFIGDNKFSPPVDSLEEARTVRDELSKSNPSGSGSGDTEEVT